jgi:RNA polymerase sigma-70 factor, ECF subfamily
MAVDPILTSGEIGPYPNRSAGSGLLEGVDIAVASEVPGNRRLTELRQLDVDTFYEAVSPYLDKMARVAGRLANFQEQDDVVQTALAQAWEHRASFDPSKGALSAWILAITAHEATKVRRRLARRIWSSEAEAKAGDVEREIDLNSALRRLSPRERLAVDLRYFADLSTSEAAAVMGCSEGTVKSTLASARQRLRTLLG